MAGGKSKILVNRCAFLRVTFDALRRGLAERSHVSNKLLELGFAEPSHARHRRIRNAVPDHVRQRRIVRRMIEPWTIEVGCICSGAIDAMALNAHTLEKPPAPVDVRIVLRSGSRRDKA